MRIYTAKNAGFCFGVKRAMDMAYKCAGARDKGGIYSLHEIIHNPQEVKRLEEAGAKHVENIKDVKKGSTVIISTHGITPAEEKALAVKKTRALDTTCPYVKKIHGIAGKLAAEGYDVVVFGDREHLEVKGIMGYAGKNGKVITGKKDAAKLITGRKTGIVSQTTKNEEEYLEIIGIITGNVFKVRQAEVRAFHTICDATRQRQDETVKLAKKTDVMIIIGGKNSANTKRLYELSRRVLKNTHHVESADELKKAWFRDCMSAGVSGGASTPDGAIEAVVKRIMEITA